MLYGSPRNTLNGGSLAGPDPLPNAKWGGCAVQDPQIPGENAVLINLDTKLPQNAN